MAGHLVAVEVGVVRRTNERVQFDGATFPKDRFERLDTQAVQGRRAVQQNRMFVDDIFKDIPYFRRNFFDFFLRIFDVVRQTASHEFFHDKRFEEFERHFLRQTALVHFEFRSDNDNGTAGVVNTLTQQVLTETALFTFQEIGK